MNYFFDVSVGDIHVFAKKSESERFRFSTTQREGGGFVCFLSGEGELSMGNSTYKISPGSFIIFEKGDDYRFDVAAPCSYIVSDMDISFAHGEALPRFINCIDEELNLMERAYRVWVEQGEYCYTEARILLLRLFNMISRRTRAEAKGQSGFISEALAYIHRNYSQNFTLDDVAQFCNVSVSYLRASFKSELGMSVMQYREELRINRAKAMILSGEFKLKEIAESLGYYDIYHFSKRFKEAVGITPGGYAENLK